MTTTVPNACSIVKGSSGARVEFAGRDSPGRLERRLGLTVLERADEETPRCGDDAEHRHHQEHPEDAGHGRSCRDGHEHDGGVHSAAELGGTLVIDSVPGEGTAVKLSMPVQGY